MLINILTAVVILVTAAAMPAVAQPGTPANPCPVGGVPTVACPVVNDAVIQAIVASRVAGLVEGPGDFIKVQSQNGVVTLTGQVQDDRQREVASVAAATTRGVVRVVNQLTLSPIAPKDLEIARQVNHELSRQAFDTSQIRVYVSDGVVTLNGYVWGDFEREQAGLVALGVKGVWSVRNNLFMREDQSGIRF
ncbi:MAG: BON domain-containing protein [Armatimonadota bacterium]|nr:BON domain-containing protein [bacterium]